MTKPAPEPLDQKSIAGEAWHHAATDVILDAVVAMDLDGRVVDWSPQAEVLFGFSRKEAMGRQLAALIVPERYRDAHWAGLERFRETGESHILNQRLGLSAMHRNGREFPVELSISLLRLGTKALFTAVVREVPERSAGTRRARFALESRLLHQVTSLSTSAESFDDALRQCVEVMCAVTGWPVGHVFIPDSEGEQLTSTGIWHFREEGSYTSIRDASERLRFRRGEGLPGRIWETGEAIWSANIQEDRLFHRALDGVDLGVQGAFGFPVSVNGNTVAILEFFTPDEVTPDPQLLMLVGSIGTQLGRILERRQWEDERAKLAAIVDSSYDAIIGKTLTGTILTWNTGAVHTYGYSAEEAVGQSIKIILPEGMTEEEQEIRKAVRTGRRLTQFETVRHRRDGTQVAVALTVSPIRDSQGRIVGSSTIERDITRRIERERELEAAKAAAEEAKEVAEAANLTKTEFLANISHELRTPMNAIIGMLELTLDEELSPILQDYLDTARDSAHTLLYLLDDLLDFSRMEAGRLELEAEPFNTREIVDGIVKTLSLRANEKGLELATRVEADVPERLEGDGNRLRQVLINLAGNAIKFTEQGEVLVSVAVKTRKKQKVELLISVTDTGIGIPTVDQERIFAPFTQVDASTTREHSGSGLGLAICRELVEKMGGQIWVTSTSGAGTTFYLTVPFRVLADQPQPTPHISDLSELSVLVVDDNKTSLAILRETLINWNMKPTTASNGREALRQLREARERGEPFEFVIVDALMPDVDGFTLIETIQAEGLTDHPKGLTETAVILMLSSADRQTFQDRCRELDVAAFLEKPVSQSDLLDTVVTARYGPQTTSVIAPRIDKTVRPLRVLLAEDTPANQKVVRAMLEKRGHQVVIADNGREALECLKREVFDTILMDIQMPAMDGLQATAAIRELSDPRRSELPIIALTAHARRQDRRRCRQAGMDAYISKPIEPQRLIQVVETTRHLGIGDSDGASQWASDPSIDVLPPDDEPAFVSTEPDEERSVMNREAALTRLGGSEKLFADMARFLLDDSPELMTAIRDGLKAQDAEAVTRAAHSLKGLTANFDAHSTTDIAQQIEDFGRHGDLAQAEQCLPQLSEHVEQLRAELVPYAS